MHKMSNTIPVGTCSLMCPDAERRLREKEGLLHVFEIDESTKHLRRPKADSQKTIKCYSRSDAGKHITDDLKQLRPAPVLLSTVNYLITKIATLPKVDWLVIYNFLFDRLRAVRQDMTVQRLDPSTTIEILEPIVKFHIYSGQRLCERSLDDFVPTFNNQHLLECIKELLVSYEERDIDAKDKYCKNRAEAEAFYLLLYLGDRAALERGLTLPSQYRESPKVKSALRISLGWYLKNYVQVCREIVKLSPLMAMAALLNLPQIRRDTYEIMSIAYNSENLSFCGDDLRKILLFRSEELLFADCKRFGLQVINSSIKFQRKKFDVTQKLGASQRTFPDSILQSFLPDIMLK